MASFDDLFRFQQIDKALQSDIEWLSSDCVLKKYRLKFYKNSILGLQFLKKQKVYILPLDFLMPL